MVDLARDTKKEKKKKKKKKKGKKKKTPKNLKSGKGRKKKRLHGELERGAVIVILVNAEKGEGEGTKRERDLFHIRSTVLTTIFFKDLVQAFISTGESTATEQCH